jgi:ABC-type Fe3+-hydroxamate transport system substrate-binding protein
MGRRVNQVVRTEHGLIIAAPGQIVTEQVVNRARTYQKEEELIEAVGLSTTNAVYNTEGSTTPSIGASEVAAGATNLWDRLKSKVSESQQATAMEAEERRIKYAVGRPVTRVILDPQDNVILNVGEIITFHAVELSRAAGVLDMLLSSVYDKDPELSPEELRAPEPGQAAMEQQDKEVGA